MNALGTILVLIALVIATKGSIEVLNLERWHSADYLLVTTAIMFMAGVFFSIGRNNGKDSNKKPTVSEVQK